MNNIIQQTQETICTYFYTRPVARVWLFGSVARGESEPGDIDLLLELDKGVSLFDFTRFKLELEAVLNKKVDLVSSNGVSPHIKPFIDQDKQLIYERETGR
ncbi:nucleotidyltransferase family protein [Candidatus Venteria ishoeyi]|uniref:Nucleotidyltransferase domain protein n=1 Tax=Candidatus Venteria ishoeyi TaxID=1899563 RepID=A0A1H6F7M7_9GAMM|nr:nucleotidyltransferase domain-containing protein [Candidatus Venteria ishoeyi]SEH05401.1 Nucleotidyltransferase domain protein [Candidatus Venteria ishoeyi]